MARPPAPGLTRAARLLRAWRRERKLTGAAAAGLLNVEMRSLYRYERGHRAMPDAFKAQLIERNICAAADFFADDERAVCERCALRPESPEARCCTRTDCPRRVAA